MFGAPDNWDGTSVSCDTLAVSVGTMGAYRALRSYWKPTPEELALLNANGSIELSILGHNHPPVALNVVSNGEISEQASDSRW